MSIATVHITSIPELIHKHGSMAACARETGIAEITVAKYRLDKQMRDHAIVNGRLLSARSHSKIIPPEKL